MEKLLVRLDYPRTKTRYDERILSYHKVKFFHIDEEDREDADKFDVTIKLQSEGGYVIYGENIPSRTYSNLDACLHYVVGGQFGNWRDNWSIG